MSKKEYTFSQPYAGMSNIYMNSSSFEPSSYSNLNPQTGTYVTAGSLGTTTNPSTANILQEASSRVSLGAKHIEISQVSPQVFDSIPKQQLKEVHRLSKLTGVDISMHAPIIEASGVTKQGYSEIEKESAERKITEALLRAHELNPDKSIPVVFHSSGEIPGSQLLTEAERKRLEKEGKQEEYKRLIAINRETGKMAPLEGEIKFYPGMSKETLERGKYYPTKNRLDNLNATEWDNQISQILFQKERADEILEKNRIWIEHLIEDFETGRINEKKLGKLSQEQLKAYHHYRNAHVYLQELHQQASGLFNKAYEFSTNDEQKQKLKEISNNFKEMISKSQTKENPFPNPFVESQAFQELIHNLKNPEIIPEMYVPIEKFAIEKSSETFGKSAFEAYKTLKDKTPFLAIENPPAGAGLSTGEDIANLVKASREQFIRYATKNGISEKEAKKEAERLIGATWDVGHINMLRGQGFTEEEIVKETEKVAPFVKHVHLSDNFGFEHTELPMGMGNVPLQRMMERLGEKGFEAKKIIEAGNWLEHFKTSPFQPTLEAVGAPVYSPAGTAWAQTPGFYQGYSQGLGGEWLPQIHYETFGAGFSRLPPELGGSTPGRGGRLGGGGME